MDTGQDRDVDDILRRRYWLKDNFEWFMNEVVFHREMKVYFYQPKIELWHVGAMESRVKVNHEIAFGSNEV